MPYSPALLWLRGAWHTANTMQTQRVIEGRDLTVTFGDTPLFEGVSFSIASGEHIALTGASGTGKSTVLRCLLGFVEPTRGEIAVHGKALTPHSVWRIRSQMAFVPQEADLGLGRAREFIDRPFQYRVNIPKGANRERLPELLQAVGLNDALLSSEIGSLSGGEKQRIALVSALLLDRPILLLDEVTSALDKENTARVQSLLASLKDKTIIGVVHEEDGMPFATRQIAIRRGGA